MTEIQSKKIKINACDIHLLTAGDPKNRTVLLLHGMKFQASTWQELGTLEQLADAGFHAAALDMPGFGRTPACSVDQDEVILKSIGEITRDPVILVGPSMGGRIALEFALAHQKLLAGLVLVGSVGVEENRDSLSHITIPTLLVWGSEDRISPLSNCDLLAASVAGAEKIIIEGAPHPCYLDKPDTWHTELIRFIKTLTG